MDRDRIEENSPSTPPRKKVRVDTRRLQKFRNVWTNESDFRTWLSPDPSNKFKAKCTLCSLTMTAELALIRNHGKSRSHLAKIGTVRNQKTITAFTEPTIDNKQTQSVKRAEIKLCGFLVDHNLPMSTVDHLTPLIKSCFPDSKIAQSIQLKSTKSTAIIRNVVGESETNHLGAKLKSQFFSILIDESTDISAIKTMCIVVRFYDPEMEKVSSRFWELCQVFNDEDYAKSASAEHLFNCLKKTFDAQGVDFATVIGFASDGCNTMMGTGNSVASRFRDLCPNITILKCICHSLHLCASNACRELPRACEDLAHGVYNFFKASAKRQFALKEFQTFLDLKIHKLLHPSQTRWLSLNAVVSRLLERWKTLILFFTEKVYSERLLAVELILKTLKNPLIKVYYLFLKWVLPKFTKLNQLFQSAKPVITVMHDVVCLTYQDLLKSYMTADYIDKTPLHAIDLSNSARFLSLQQIYLGVDVTTFFNKPEYRQNVEFKNDFLKGCIKFLVTGCAQIKSRFDFHDPLMQNLTVLSPSQAILQKTMTSTPSLLPLMELLPRVVTPEQYQNIDDEWRQLPNFELSGDMSVNDDIDVFWHKLLHSGPGDQNFIGFENLSEFALNVLSLPHSNADCERVFSGVNLIKTKTRNKLITSTVNGILLAKQRVQSDCINFEPTKGEHRRMTTSSLYTESTEPKSKATATASALNYHFDSENDVVLPHNF